MVAETYLQNHFELKWSDSIYFSGGNYDSSQESPDTWPPALPIFNSVFFRMLPVSFQKNWQWHPPTSDPFHSSQMLQNQKIQNSLCCTSGSRLPSQTPLPPPHGLPPALATQGGYHWHTPASCFLASGAVFPLSFFHLLNYYSSFNTQFKWLFTLAMI